VRRFSAALLPWNNTNRTLVRRHWKPCRRLKPALILWGIAKRGPEGPHYPSKREPEGPHYPSKRAPEGPHTRATAHL